MPTPLAVFVAVGQRIRVRRGEPAPTDQLPSAPRASADLAYGDAIDE
jgi:hypothetical protein